MKLVFVNMAHPLTPHVSGMRLFCFAKAMAKRGHKVVLLTGAPPDGESDSIQECDIITRLATHDWVEPMLVAVAPSSARRGSRLGDARFPSLLRRLATAWKFLVRGGVFADWSEAAKPVAKVLAGSFRPDLVWATFGNTSNLTLGQYLARHAKCPWIPDIKDNWRAFVPFGLRTLMALRFRNASALTSNAEHHLEIAASWFQQPNAEVVYSGVADSFYQARDEPREETREATVLLIGSTYSTTRLDQFLSAFKQWRETLGGGERARLHYAGSDSAQVLQSVQEAGLVDATMIQGQLPLSELASQVRGATAVCYLWAPYTFHHKLMELLVVGTPLIAYPGEHTESLRLASTCVTPFHVCKDQTQLMAAFDQVLSSDRKGVSIAEPPEWRWSDFSAKLGTCFIQVIAGKSTKCAE